MDDFIFISLLFLVMLVGCYVVGIIFLVVNFLEEWLKLVIVLGVGFFCGIVLVVIVFEGVYVFYEDIFEGKYY